MALTLNFSISVIITSINLTQHSPLFNSLIKTILLLPLWFFKDIKNTFRNQNSIHHQFWYVRGMLYFDFNSTIKRTLEYKEREHILHILWTKILRTQIEFCRNGNIHVRSSKLPRGSKNPLRMGNINAYKYLSDNNKGSGLYSLLNSSFIMVN